jgi:hypothetical protein
VMSIDSVANAAFKEGNNNRIEIASKAFLM